MYRTVFSKSKVAIILLLAVFTSCHSGEAHLPYYNTPDFTPLFIDHPNDVDRRINHVIDNFSFTDQDGKTITQKDIEGKIHVADFIFTSCGNICPRMTSHLMKASNKFMNDSNVVFLSFSVTPWIDSVPVLKAYKETNHITNPHWHFLTGDQAKIYHLARTSYFAEEDLGFTKDSTSFLHTEHLLLVDKNKRIRGIYNGTLALDIDHLIADISLLEKENRTP